MLGITSDYTVNSRPRQANTSFLWILKYSFEGSQRSLNFLHILKLCDLGSASVSQSLCWLGSEVCPDRLIQDFSGEKLHSKLADSQGWWARGPWPMHPLRTWVLGAQGQQQWCWWEQRSGQHLWVQHLCGHSRGGHRQPQWPPLLLAVFTSVAGDKTSQTGVSRWQSWHQQRSHPVPQPGQHWAAGPQRIDLSLRSRPEARAGEQRGIQGCGFGDGGLQIYFGVGGLSLWHVCHSTDHEWQVASCSCPRNAPVHGQAVSVMPLPLRGAGDHVPVIDCLMLAPSPHPQQGLWTGDSSFLDVLLPG